MMNELFSGNMLNDKGFARVQNIGRAFDTQQRLSEDQASTLCAPPVYRSDSEREADQKPRLFRVLDRWVYRHPRLRMLLLECRNFLHRIRTVLRNTDTSEVPTGFLYLESQSGCVYPNIRNLGRSECIRRIAAIRPTATPLDWNLWREAWDQGVEWALHNLDFDSPSTDEHKALLASELTYPGPQS